MMNATTTGSSGKNWKQIGEDAWKRADKINGELFSLTYGALVSQLLRDLEDPAAVNLALDKLGYSLGTRLIDEFLARTPARCADFRETGEVIKCAFKQFLGIQVTVAEGMIITLPEVDGLGSEWVELPEEAIKGGLHYANVLCGVIRGALEMVNMQVECTISADPLLNPAVGATELRVKFIKYIEEELPPGDE